MPSLNWIGKEKIVNHDKDVAFRLLKKNKTYSLGESENLIQIKNFAFIDGQNLYMNTAKKEIGSIKQKKRVP